MAKPFASSADTETQKPRLVELADGVYGFLSDFDPNTGFVVGDDSCLAVDCRATPALGRDMLAAIATVTDLPVRHIFLTHYHAVRVFGRAAFTDATTVIASRNTLALVRERGADDFESEARRFPRLFEGVEEVQGPTVPNLTFERETTLWLGERELRFEHVGRGHTKGDSVLWLPAEKILFAGDLVEARCALYCGDAYLFRWMDTLDALAALEPEVVVPGRGDAVFGRDAVRQAIGQTRRFIEDLVGAVRQVVDAEGDLEAAFHHAYEAMTPRYGEWPIYEHCIPFNVSRAFDEIRGITDPVIWTAQRDREMWSALQG